ncbi:MAG: sugar ABC transporter ATP-binding protein [Phycisphaerae bacterium]|nr:sugar ABC transporter ATP-binding protein [Phycisphaerae bacterium]
MSEPSPLLRVSALSKRYGRVAALDAVDLDVSRASIHALMGENGAGKSTLIKCLTGAVSRDSGRFQLDGRDLDPTSPRDAEGAGISTVFQEINLIPHMSIAENITLGRESFRAGLIDRKAARRRAEGAIARLGLSIDVSREVSSCSIAIQQLVAIARALDVQARLLILDEPTSSLDRTETARLFETLRRLRDAGLAVLFVTHFLDQVYAVADQITVLRDAKHVATRATSAFPRLELVSAMLGRAILPSSTSVNAGPEQQSPSLATKPSTNPSQAVSSPSGSPPFTDGSSAAPPPESRPEPSPRPTRDLLSLRAVSLAGSIEHADLSIAPGEAVGLAGLLGSGRTELAKVIFGLDRADSGSMSLDGQPYSPRSPRDAIARGVALTPENRKADGIVPSLSVRENILLALQARLGVWRSLSTRRRRDIAADLIAKLGVKAASADAPIASLSGGNQQKALLARWLATDPKLLILDEPTRGIDVGAKQAIERLIASLISGGLGVLFISSELPEIVRTCTRACVLRDRRTVAEVAGPSLTEERVMEAIATHD